MLIDFENFINKPVFCMNKKEEEKLLLSFRKIKQKKYVLKILEIFQTIKRAHKEKNLDLAGEKIRLISSMVLNIMREEKLPHETRIRELVTIALIKLQYRDLQKAISKTKKVIDILEHEEIWNGEGRAVG